ncbi:MerR family transcriptional regulator [Actinoallomurus sp. CA-150999]|uniref:MerR family transcriptional regulator n=1 Tax=Actinoallomurus sp. CA-150999 TaxID=3239887 RepID=UPI003D8F629F
MHRNADGITPTRWDWIAVACGLASGEWLRPGEAAHLARTDTATLRHWAERGLISATQDAAHGHHRYLKAEIEEIAERTDYVSRPSMKLLCQLLSDALPT